MRRIAMAILAFFLTLIPLVSASLLTASLEDGLSGCEVPPLAQFASVFAPIGPLIFATPLVVAMGVAHRTKPMGSGSDTLYALFAAVMSFGITVGAMVPAAKVLIDLDGSTAPVPIARWIANVALFLLALTFTAVPWWQGRASRR